MSCGGSLPISVNCGGPLLAERAPLLSERAPSLSEPELAVAEAEEGASGASAAAELAAAEGSFGFGSFVVGFFIVLNDHVRLATAHKWNSFWQNFFSRRFYAHHYDLMTTLNI